MNIHHLIITYAIPLAAGAVFINEVGFPSFVPMEFILLMVGAYKVHSLPVLLGGVVMLTAADVMGTTCLFFVVRYGSRRWPKLAQRLLPAPSPDSRMVCWLRSAPLIVPVIGLVRATPCWRMWGTVVLGNSPVRVKHFLAGCAPGGAIWTGCPLGLGYHFHTQVVMIDAEYSHASHILSLAFIAVALGFACWRLWHRVA